MKKFIIWVAAIMLISFGIGMTIINNASYIKFEKKEISDQKSISLENISDIEFNGISEGIEISRSDGADLEVSLTGQVSGKDRNASIKLEKVNDNKILVGVERPKFFIGFIDIKPLKINLPKGYTKELKVESVSGRVQSSDLSNLEKTEVKTVSGEVDLRELEGKVKVSTVSGEINLSLSTLNNDLDIDSTSGKINLDLPSDSSYNLIFDSLSGHFENNTSNKFNTSGRRNYDGSVNGGKYAIDVKTTSGELELND
jgi:DUF4097 and DUF4098 domain-containing protein YvlB